MRTSRLLHTLITTLAFAGTLLAGSTSSAQEDVFIHVLGVVQDAGYPQIGCYAEHCLPGWDDPGLRRGATSIAVVDSAAGEKFLFEATPHLTAQWHELELAAPSSAHEFTGLFLTHAHIGHYAGLMFFGREAMGASNIPVFAMPRMAEYLSTNGPWSQLVELENIAITVMQADRANRFSNLSVTPFRVPHRDEYSETVGYRIEGPRRSALFIPDIDKWDIWQRDIRQLIETVDYALVDGSFFDGNELPGRDMAQIPHPSVTESMALFDPLPATQRAKIWFIHMNHTNPLLDATSPQHRQVIEAGYNVAREGDRLPL